MKMAMDQTDMTWVPVRKGEIYCAPACGRGCTWREYQAAQRSAKRMIKQLRNVPTPFEQFDDEWEAYVRENLGWFSSVSKGSISVYDHGHLYSAFLNVSGPWGGNLVVQARTPKEAVLSLLESAWVQSQPLVKWVRRLEELELEQELNTLKGRENDRSKKVRRGNGRKDAAHHRGR